MENQEKKTSFTIGLYWKILLILLLSIIAHFAVLNAPFIYDDEPALLFNADVQGTAPLSRIWLNDFWGAPIYRNSSHKSYRPITVLYFRCIHNIWGDWSTIFHINNIILHAVASVLFFLVCTCYISTSFDELSHLLAGVMFALHPIHTEVVCGIVCCAELLSTICFMVSLLLFSQVFIYADSKPEETDGISTKMKKCDHKRKPGDDISESNILSKEINRQDYPIATCNVTLDPCGNRLNPCYTQHMAPYVVVGGCFNKTRPYSIGDTRGLSTIYPIFYNSENEALTMDDGDGLQTLRKRPNKQKVVGTQPIRTTSEENSRIVMQCNSQCLYNWLSLFTSLAVATLGMLCKETSITVLGVFIVCLFMDKIAKKKSIKNSLLSLMDYRFALKIFFILFWGLLALLLRMKVMGWKRPSFDKVTNPIPYEESKLIRFLNYSYLCWFNFLLLVCPINLSYDYSLGSIPLITSVYEIRNLVSMLFLISCLGLLIIAVLRLQDQVASAKPFLLGLSLMIIPFFPASNLLFSVGFVVAERVLYLPCAGFIVLIILLYQSLLSRLPFFRLFWHFIMATLILFYLGQTVNRSFDWTSEDRLFRANLVHYPDNTKIHYNWGHRLQKTKRYTEAAEEYKKALAIDPHNYGAVNNLANILALQKAPPDEIEKLYERGTKIDPRREKAFANLAAFLMQRNRDDEAIKVLAKAMKTVQSGFSEIAEVARMLVAKTNKTQAKRVLYHLIKSSCFIAEHQPAMERCAKTLVPALQDIVDQIKKKGEGKKVKAYEAQIARIKATDWDTLDKFAKALSNAWTIDAAFFAMMTDIEDNEKDLKTVQQSENSLWGRATNLFRNQRYQEARKIYEILIRKYPQNLEAKGQYAALLFEIGAVDQARQILEDITMQDETCSFTGAWHNLATLHGKQGNFEKAIVLLNTCLDKIYKTFSKKKPLLNKNQIVILCQLGKHEKHRSNQLKEHGKKKEADSLWKQALERLKKVIKLDPGNQEAQSALLQME